MIDLPDGICRTGSTALLDQPVDTLVDQPVDTLLDQPVDTLARCGADPVVGPAQLVDRPISNVPL